MKKTARPLRAEGARHARRAEGARHVAENVQYAALPWRVVDGALEVLLITTRNTRRWIVPKGWPIAEYTPEACAAYEAMEEAGVSGVVDPRALGTFHYDKLRKSGEVLACKVYVFPMKVTRRRRKWAEKSVRNCEWCSIDEAVSRVTEAGLRRLIKKFAKAIN